MSQDDVLFIAGVYLSMSSMGDRKVCFRVREGVNGAVLKHFATKDLINSSRPSTEYVSFRVWWLEACYHREFDKLVLDINTVCIFPRG